MKKLSHLVDLAFCCLLLPLMIIIFPVERWAHNFPLYTLSAGVWLYGAYALNRILVVPLMFKSHRKAVLGAALIVMSIVITALFARVQLYTPKPHPFDVGFERHLPIVEQYQQCLWSLFVIVEFFSIAFGVMQEFYIQRTQWLFQAAEQAAVCDELRASIATPTVAQDTVTIKSGHKNVVVKTADIRYVEAMDNYVKVYCLGDSMLLCQTTMKAMEALLPPEAFVRVHRSYIVAKAHIESYNSRELVVASQSIPIGRKYSANLK